MVVELYVFAVWVCKLWVITFRGFFRQRSLITVAPVMYVCVCACSSVCTCVKCVKGHSLLCVQLFRILWAKSRDVRLQRYEFVGLPPFWSTYPPLWGREIYCKNASASISNSGCLEFQACVIIPETHGWNTHGMCSALSQPEGVISAYYITLQPIILVEQKRNRHRDNRIIQDNPHSDKISLIKVIPRRGYKARAQHSWF